MKLIRNNTVVLHVNDEYVIIMKKDAGASAWDPMGMFWGLAQGYRVVADTPTKTLVLVPLGEPSRVSFSDFKEEDLAEPRFEFKMPEIKTQGHFS